MGLWNCLAPPGGGTLQNSRRCPWLARSGNGALILPGEVMGALPKFLFLSLHSVPRMGLIFKSLPGRRACFLRNLTLSVYYCLSLVCFISCYLICDSEPTKNSFQLRCSPHAISSQQNHILHYWESISPAWLSPAPGKKCHHREIWQFRRGQGGSLNGISAAKQGPFTAVLPGGRESATRVREGSKGAAFTEHPRLTRDCEVFPIGITMGSPRRGPGRQWFFNSYLTDKQKQGPENLTAVPKDKSWSVCWPAIQRIFFPQELLASFSMTQAHWEANPTRHLLSVKFADAPTVMREGTFLESK